MRSADPFSTSQAPVRGARPQRPLWTKELPDGSARASLRAPGVNRTRPDPLSRSGR